MYRLACICICIFYIAATCASGAVPAHANEKEQPLAQTDQRVIEGNKQYDERIEKTLLDMQAKANAYQKQQKPVGDWIAFDENQADWEQYYRDETRAYSYADFWTRENAESEYDNLYKKNRLLAIESRQKLIEELMQGKKATNKTTERLQAEKTAIMAEIKEAEYRVTAWTKETLRQRIVRTRASWQQYADSTMLLIKRLYKDDRKLWAETELQLLQMRRDMAFQQMEALWRIKFEPED